MVWPHLMVPVGATTEEAARSGSGPAVAVEVELVVIVIGVWSSPTPWRAIGIQVVGDVVAVLGHGQAEIRVVRDGEGLDRGQGEGLDEVNRLVAAHRRHGDGADADGGRVAVIEPLGCQRQNGLGLGRAAGDWLVIWAVTVIVLPQVGSWA